MTLKRWLPTFLAFPIGGYLAFATVGSVTDPASAAAGGLLAGAVIGAGQWLALRSEGIGGRWAAVHRRGDGRGLRARRRRDRRPAPRRPTFCSSALVAGAAVGAAQSALLGSRRLAWTAVTAASWALAWFVSAAVLGQQADEGFIVFGSSGALVATLLTGLALRRASASPASS